MADFTHRRRGSGEHLSPAATLDWAGLALACLFCLGVLVIGILGGTVLAQILWAVMA